MVLSNRVAVLLLGVVVGGLLSFGRVGAEAFLLSTFEPIYAIYVATAGSLAFSFVLPRVDWDSTKFAKIAGYSTLGFAVLLGLMTLLGGAPSVQALFWYWLVIFSTAFHRWVTGEILMRHVNPAIAQSYFAYIGTAYEVGTVTVMGALTLYSGELSPVSTMLWMVGMYLVLFVLIMVHFLPARNLEVKYEDRGESVGSQELPKLPAMKTFWIYFGVITAMLGAMKVSEGYLVTIVLKEELGSYEAIRNMMAQYYFAGSFIIILVGLATGRIVQIKRVSPIVMFVFYMAIVLVTAIIAVATNAFMVFICLAVLQRVGEACFYNPGLHMVFSGFSGRMKTQIRSAHSTYYYTAVGLPLALLFSYTSVAMESERDMLGWILIVLLVAGLAMILKFETSLVDTLYAHVYHGVKSSKIAAVQTLSFLKPPRYGHKMSRLLEENPKRVLRKTIILGLGYVDDDEKATDAILQQFRSDQEEIQIAVLDALKASSRYEAIQFMAKIMMAKEESHSLKVRMNAARMIAALYGRKAIPFLLNGLEDTDVRVVANTLEVLSVFRDAHLVRYFREFVESSVPRVRANALMGLAGYRKHRKRYEDTTREILEGNDTHMLVSILYVIGSIQDRSFMRHLDNLMVSPLAEDPMVRRGLAWALTRLDDDRGFELFVQLLKTPWQEGEREPAFMHFISQLSRDVRFDLVKFIAVHHYDDTDVIVGANHKFEDSHFDFHEEIQYLEILIDTIAFSRYDSAFADGTSEEVLPS